jgi:hypothetical protein
MQNDTTGFGVYSDIQGFFTLDSIPVGKYDLRIVFKGWYQTYLIKDIEIEENTVKDIGEIQLLVIFLPITEKDSFKHHRKSNKKTKHNKSTN